MEKQFVTYDLAAKFRELGFKEPCFGYFRNEILVQILGFRNMNSANPNMVSAPLWQQAYDWLIQKLDFYYPMLEVTIFSDESGAWCQSYDALTDNEEVHVCFDNKEEMILGAIKLLEKCKK